MAIAPKRLERLKAILDGHTPPSEDDRVALLELAAMCGVVSLYEHYRDDVLARFSVEELQTIVACTEPFREVAVEHIYHTALFG